MRWAKSGQIRDAPPAMEHAMTVAAPDAGLQLTAEQAATLAALKQIRDQAGGALCVVRGV